MKRRKKIHFKTSADPISSGQQISADCGLSVIKPEILHTWDDLKVGTELELPEAFNSLNLCTKCVFLVLSSHSEGLTRLYSIREKPEEKDGQRKKAKLHARRAE